MTYLRNLRIISVYTHTSRKLQVLVETSNPNEYPEEKTSKYRQLHS